MILPVVMAGGSGSRLWPLSRHHFPKQFLNLDGDDTMLQATLKRLASLAHAQPTVICNEEHRFIVAEQLRNTGQHAHIILEPVGRNTAPAIALAALQATADGSDPILLVLAADHLIKNEEAFCAAIRQGESIANQGQLVTFGIVPTAPETGYGYIKGGAEFGNEKAYRVAEFKEKPDAHTAQNYLDSGDYFWNSGMFMFKASRFLEELKQYREDIFLACERALEHTSSDLDFIRVDEAAFRACPEDSVDYAVMEKTDSAVVIPVDCGWSDVGSWSALWEVSDKDKKGNVVRGDVITIDCNNSYIHTEEKLVAAIGVDDLIILDTKDATLVTRQSEVQKVKNIVQQLKKEGRSQWLHHREVYRPWGKYDSLDGGQRFQVKRITVKPGEKLSTQMHHHRAEHWIVVSGTAKVTNGEEEYLLSENQSTYIALGQKHSLENPGKVPLEIIEVQSGTYFGEDDIVRLSDKYGRVAPVNPVDKGKEPKN